MSITATKAQYQRAIDRSRKLGGAARATWLGGFTYAVAGETATYRVYWQGDNVRCSCPAGGKGKLCWHVPAVWTRRLGKEMIVRGAGAAA